MRRSSSALATCGRAALVGREQADFLGGADFFQHRVERVLREVGEVGVLPDLHHAGERELHAGDVRHDDEAVLAELVAHVAGEAVEHRVAVDQQGDALVGRPSRSWRRAVEVAAEIVCRSAFDLGTSASVRSVPSSTSASAMIWRTLFGDGFEAVVADADDVDLWRQEDAGSRDAGARAIRDCGDQYSKCVARSLQAPTHAARRIVRSSAVHPASLHPDILLSLCLTPPRSSAA